jgi:hypothetical protein
MTHFATMVGAVSLARSIAKADPSLSDEILEAALANLETSRTKGRDEAARQPRAKSGAGARQKR